MIDTINPEAFMVIKPRNIPGFYEISTRNDGDIVIIKRIAPLDARLTD